jgi:hypothetical protein
MAVRIKRELGSILKRVEEQLDEVRDGFLHKMAETVVGFSPVDSGAYVESHSITTRSGSGRARSSDARPSRQIPEEKRGVALDQLQADIESLPRDTTKVYLNNRSPHNKAVEYGGHNWRRGGYYVYERTRALAPALLEEAIQEAKR